jgi:HlyD family secretion protein
MSMKRVVSLVVVAALAGAGVWAYLYAQSRGNAPRYRTVPVERGPLVASVSATGNLNAVTTVLVGSQVSGQVRELFADFNSIVERGQVIARIDPATFEAKVNQAQADLENIQASVLNQQAQVERARAEVENARAAHAEARAQTAKARVAVVDARRDLERKNELFRRELIARSERDTAEATHDSAVAELEATRAKEQAVAAGIQSAAAQLRVAEAMLQSARAQVRQKQAALAQARVDLEHTFIRAPVNGVVVSRQVDVGQTVAASLQAPTLFTIAQDLTKMQVETSVDEADIGRVTVGDRATFTVDAFPGQSFTGAVVQIRKAALVVQNVVTYTVVLGVDNPGGRLLPGMTANVRLVVEEKPSVLKVPNAALRYRPVGVDPGPAGPSPAARGGGPASAPPGPAGPGREGRPSLEQIRDRLTASLGLDADQQKRLEAILRDGREQLSALGDVPEEERRAQARQMREATRDRIREILTGEQRARYDAQLVGRDGGESGGTPGRVWVVDGDKPRAVTLVLGLSDGSTTEVLRGELQEGQEVIVGTVSGTAPGRAGTGPRLRL